MGKVAVYVISALVFASGCAVTGKAPAGDMRDIFRGMSILQDGHQMPRLRGATQDSLEFGVSNGVVMSGFWLNRTDLKWVWQRDMVVKGDVIRVESFVFASPVNAAKRFEAAHIGGGNLRVHRHEELDGIQIVMYCPERKKADIEGGDSVGTGYNIRGIAVRKGAFVRYDIATSDPVRADLPGVLEIVGHALVAWK
jgi:hypothetical protein